MRNALFALALVVGMASVGRAAKPDPMDSIIIESKTVPAGLSGAPAFTLKVYITNKDTVGILTLVLVESTLTRTGSAYAVLDSTGSPQDPDRWSLGDCVSFLKNTLDGFPVQDFADYDGTSPDRFMVVATWAPQKTNPMNRAEPPNAVRTPVWELQFMSTAKSTGKVILDTAQNERAPAVRTGFTILRKQAQIVQDAPVNFVPAIITVGAPKKESPKKGELFPGFPRPVKEAFPVSSGSLSWSLNRKGETTAVPRRPFGQAIWRDEKIYG